MLTARVHAAPGQAGYIHNTLVVLQVYKAKLLCDMDESGPDQAAFKELRSATNLALRNTANLVVIESHLWLNLSEIKDANKTALLESPVSPSGLFGSMVDGFAECFTVAQKSSQAMRHVLRHFAVRQKRLMQCE